MVKKITDAIQASVVIQSFWRGTQVRKRLALTHAKADQMTQHITFLIGNDPKIKNLDYYATKVGKIALVGTSGLRSLELICELGNKGHVPKLIIIDNSVKVIAFWRRLRAWVIAYTFNNQDIFLQDFNNFLNANIELYLVAPENDCTKQNRPGVEYENQNPFLFMNRVITKHGLDYVLAIIKNATIIGQTWADNKLFLSLKNILKHNKIETIYAYPSNIKACIRNSEVQNFINSIKILDPILTIHTDINLRKRMPEFVTFQLNTTSKKRKPIEQTNKINSTNFIVRGVEFFTRSSFNFFDFLSYKQPQEEQQCNIRNFPA